MNSMSSSDRRCWKLNSVTKNQQTRSVALLRTSKSEIKYFSRQNISVLLDPLKNSPINI